MNNVISINSYICEDITIMQNGVFNILYNKRKQHVHLIVKVNEYLSRSFIFKIDEFDHILQCYHEEINSYVVVYMGNKKKSDDIITIPKHVFDTLYQEYMSNKDDFIVKKDKKSSK